MLALEMEKSDVKNFMGNLLREDLFDCFEVRLIEIAAAARFTIDAANESGDFASWGDLRPLVYEIIKLSPKPRQIKIVFAGKTEIHTNAAAMFLNLTYENDSVNFTTATSQKEFALDKTVDIAWDSHIREFFAQVKINVKDRE